MGRARVIIRLVELFVGAPGPSRVALLGQPGIGTHVLFIIENQPYPYDPRVRAQAAALVEAGHAVTVAGPTGEGFELEDETIQGVRVRRFPAPVPGRRPAGYIREYLVALLRLGRLTLRTQRQHPVDLVFVCNPPDFLMLLALPLARRGAAVVFDDRELSPELFELKFSRRGPLYQALLRAEGWAFHHADTVLITNESYIDNVCRRGRLPRSRVFVVGNGPDPSRIFPVEPVHELRRGRPHLVLWMGAMSKQEGLGQLLAAADELVNGRGRSEITFALVGPGDIHDALESDIRRRNLSMVVHLPGRVDDVLVRAYLATADVCVSVDGRSSMNDRAAMRKVFEYMAMGRAVVQCPLQEMQRLCGDATSYAEHADPRDLADRIEALLDSGQERTRLGNAARAQLVEQNLMWPQQVPALLSAVSAALEGSRERSSMRNRAARRASRWTV